MDHGERSCLRLFQCSGIMAFQTSLLKLPALKKALTSRFAVPFKTAY